MTQSNPRNTKSNKASWKHSDWKLRLQTDGHMAVLCVKWERKSNLQQLSYSQVDVTSNIQK